MDISCSITKMPNNQMKWVKFNSRGKNILFLSSLSSKCVSAQRFVLGNGNEYVLRQVLVFTVLHHNNYSLCFVFPNFRYYKGFFSTFLQHIYTCTCTYNATRILRWHWNVSKTTKKFNFLKRWSQHQIIFTITENFGNSIESKIG